MKYRRSLSLSGSETQRRSLHRYSHLSLSGACVCAALALDACTLTTSLDFVGNSPGTQTTTPGGGGSSLGGGGTDAVGGNTGTGPDVGATSVSTNGSAGTGGESAVTSGAAGMVGEAGAAGTAGTTGTAIPACDDLCAEHGICSGDSCQCPSALPACSNGCSNAIEAAGFCGSCGKVCRDDQRCQGGACECLEVGKAACSSGCVSLDSDPEHCGKCEHACSQGQPCIAGACRSSPCDGFCTNPEAMDLANDGWRKENLGTGEKCLTASRYQPEATKARLVCWNFESARTLKINGSMVACPNDNAGIPLPRQPDGWYCIQVATGDWPEAGMLLPKY